MADEKGDYRPGDARREVFYFVNDFERASRPTSMCWRNDKDYGLGDRASQCLPVAATLDFRLDMAGG